MAMKCFWMFMPCSGEILKYSIRNILREIHVFAIYYYVTVSAFICRSSFFRMTLFFIFHILVLVLILMLILLVRLHPVESAAIFPSFNICLTLILWSMLYTYTYHIKMNGCVWVRNSVNVHVICLGTRWEIVQKSMSA